MIKKDTILFLKALKENNTREWFAENNEWYRRAHADFEQLVSKMIQAIAPFDAGVTGREAKKCIFRIYRDVRFSNDKSPFKINFGASMGNKTHGYYVHLSPDECFLACGYYMPTPEELKKIRRGIYTDFETLKNIVDKQSFKKEIGDLCRDDDTLQRVPTGFEKEHPSAEYLKLKRFYMTKPLSMEQVQSADFEKYAANIFKLMQPMMQFLNELVNE